MIDQISPDVLALQEVGDPAAALDDLRERLDGDCLAESSELSTWSAAT